MLSQFKRMESEFYAAARKLLMDGVAALPPEWQRNFRLMYGRNGGRRSVEDSSTLPLDVVIAEVPNESLDWAMQQVQNSHDKLAKEPKP